MVISRACDTRAGQLFPSSSACVRARQSAFYTCDRYGTSFDCCWDTPLQASVFKKNLQQTPNHICGACHVKSFSRWNVWFVFFFLVCFFFPPLHRPLERSFAAALECVFASCCPHIGRRGRRKAALIDVCSCRAVSFVHKRHVAPSLWPRFPPGNAAICCMRCLHPSPPLINNSVYLCLCSDREPKDCIKNIDSSRYTHTAPHKRGRALQNNKCDEAASPQTCVAIYLSATLCLFPILPSEVG